MGRRPNPAIRQFFERGVKLKDSSNRYQQTCKRCGEQFDKGRQESMVRHIAKICEGVSPQEREHFIAGVAAVKPGDKAKKSAVQHDGTMDRPSLSGLEALAEVSRHHGQQTMHDVERFLHQSQDPFSQIDPRFDHPSSMPGVIPVSTALDHALGFSDAHLSPQLQLAALTALHSPQVASPAPPPLPEHESSEGLVDYGHGEAPSLGANYSRHAPDLVTESVAQSRETEDGLVDYDHGQPPDMEDLREVESITLASRSVDPATRASFSNGVERHPDRMSLLVDFVHHDAAMEQPTITHESTASIHEAIPAPSPAAAPPIAPAPTVPMSEPQTSHFQRFQVWDPHGIFDTGQKKVRGAFAPDRKNAVKEVRKKGACLRCRMLKKSCDSSDPCRECAKLENSWIWQGTCTRTRLGQIFTLFSSTLFMNVAHRLVSNFVSDENPPTELPGRLEVSYFPSTGVFMTFACLRAAPSDQAAARLLLQHDDDGADALSAFGSRFTNYERKIVDRILEGSVGETYLKLSRFMTETLRTASTMQSCVLVARSIDLWLWTSLLAMPPTQLYARYEPRLPPENATITLDSNTPPSSGEDTRFIFAQIRRKLEKACDVCFKAIMAELEKSLIQRKQADNFETFIGSVLLLRALEIAGYMYKGFDHLVDSTATSRRVSLHGAKEEWPLENPPCHYWQQGERFSQLLMAMLKLRKVTLAFRVRDGRLRAEDEVKPVKEWFEAVDLGVDELAGAKNRAYDALDERAWELRWVGKLFQSGGDVLKAS